jgi:hypothetical protein
MPIAKYFFYVGALLWIVICAWAGYVGPLAPEAQPTDRLPAKVVPIYAVAPPPPIFQPTQAPTMTEPDLLERKAPELSMTNVRSHKIVNARKAKARKKKATQIGRRRDFPEDSYAYVPQRQWRPY